MEGQGQDWNEDGGRGEAEIPPGRAGKVRDELQGAARLQGDFGNPWPSIPQRCGGAARGARRVQGDPAFPDSNPGVPEHPPALQGLSLTHRTLPRQIGSKAGPKQQLGAPLLPFPRVLPNPAQARLQSRHSQLSLPLREVSRAWIPSDLEPWGSRSWIHPFGCFCILPAGHGHTALGFFQPGTSISPVFFPQGQREVWNVLPNPFSFLHPSSG